MALPAVETSKTFKVDHDDDDDDNESLLLTTGDVNASVRKIPIRKTLLTGSCLRAYRKRMTKAERAAIYASGAAGCATASVVSARRMSTAMARFIISRTASFPLSI